MKTMTFCCVIFLFCTPSVFKAQNDSAQTPHLTADRIKSGLLSLKFKGAWHYQKGDNLNWSKPDFDDSKWQALMPESLRAEAMPDSLWQGYGWWRLHFTMDSSLYSVITHMHFRSWGAAEVYLDGENVNNYGTFSTQPATERNYIPRYVLDNALKIKPAATHVLAIRYSNHQAKKNQAILKQNAPFLGFTIGFSNDSKAAEAELNFAGYIGSHSVVTAILLLLFLLHALLFFKFPKDSSNLAVLAVITCFLISIATNYAGLFIEITGLRNALLRGIINSTAFGLAIVLLPYTLSLIFRLDKFAWTKHLVWMAILRSILYFYPIIPIVYSDSVFIVIVFFIIGWVMYHAIKTKQPSVHYLTAGAIGSTIFILIDRLYATNTIYLSTENFYLIVVLSFICFPVGLSVYITSRYGTLFSAMEQEVANRTAALNQSLKELTDSQTSLAAKNAENELLLKEIHHRVKNNLEVVSSLLALQSAQIDDPSVQDAMQASQNRVQSMGILHQKLYQSEHLAFIEMKNYFMNLCENILDSYNASERVTVELPMQELELDVDTAVPIGLIVNELLTNSLKYAFDRNSTGKVRLSLIEKDKNLLELTVADNGIGKDLALNAKAQGTGFGSQLVTLLTQQLDGRIQQHIKDGTVISIEFKRAKAA
ncbi:MAG: sensor histidine kinase [Saprospiraceae bacterium]|nr:sensor histidine kinase [Saprospiraceae bacterium]